MACHVEFDFNDDGTVTMTTRPAKGEPVRSVTYTAEKIAAIAGVRILGGDNNAETHRIYVVRKEDALAMEMARYGFAA